MNQIQLQPKAEKISAKCASEMEKTDMFDPKYSELLQNIHNSVLKIKEMRWHKERKSCLWERMKSVVQFWRREDLEIFRILIT